MYQPSVTPLDHVQTYKSKCNAHQTSQKESYGIDSPVGLVFSNIFAPLYLHATLAGKFKVWDDLLDGITDDILCGPCLDVGCGRGMVLVKMAKRKKALAAKGTTTGVLPAYGIDIFNSGDQSGNDPDNTCLNLAINEALDYAILHTASFCEELPFSDSSFSLITSSLALHNVPIADRKKAIAECARVLKPGGQLIIVDIMIPGTSYGEWIKEMGWTDVTTQGAGWKMLYGIIPSRITKATKPINTTTL